MNKHTHPEDLYLIRAISNLHAGSGDRSFGLIDKEVQRDHTSGLPIIYSSSVKGALREAYQYQKLGSFIRSELTEKKNATAPEQNAAELTAEEMRKIAGQTHAEVARIFGSDNRRGQAAVLQQGNLLIRDARLLALPVRSTHQYYFMATTPGLLKAFLEAASEAAVVGKTVLEKLRDTKPTAGKPSVFGAATGINEIYLESLETELKTLENTGTIATAIGPRIALYAEDDFAKLCKDLPTVARNSLNNGISENLWYEEIVPRESVFYCPISRYGQQPESASVMRELHDIIKTNDGTIQIGANATVGYGITEWTNLNQARHEPIK